MLFNLIHLFDSYPVALLPSLSSNFNKIPPRGKNLDVPHSSLEWDLAAGTSTAQNAKKGHAHRQVGSVAMTSRQVSLSCIGRDVAQTPGREWNRQEAGFLS